MIGVLFFMFIIKTEKKREKVNKADWNQNTIENELKLEGLISYVAQCYDI